MSARKTYFCPPDESYPPSGPIAIGRIISDLADPGYSLNPDGPPEIPKNMTVSRTFVTNWKDIDRRNREGSFNILASFLDLTGVSAKLGAKAKRAADKDLRFDKISTEMINPTDKYVIESMKDEDVQRYIRETKFKKSVFMITGVKTVHGATFRSTYDRETGGHGEIKAGGPALGMPGMVGADADYTSTKSGEFSYEAGSDFVFAFSVREIYYQKGAPKHRIFAKGALYGLESDEEPKKGEDENEVLEVEVLQLADEDEEVTAAEFESRSVTGDGEEQCELVLVKTFYD